MVFTVDGVCVLRAKHSALNGLDVTLLQVDHDRDVNAENYRNVPRWTNSVKRVGGNVC